MAATHRASSAGAAKESSVAVAGVTTVAPSGSASPSDTAPSVESQTWFALGTTGLTLSRKSVSALRSASTMLVDWAPGRAGSTLTIVALATRPLPAKRRSNASPTDKS